VRPAGDRHMVASRAAAQGGAVPCLGNGSEQSGRER
jgi:hypothetical protein